MQIGPTGHFVGKAYLSESGVFNIKVVHLFSKCSVEIFSAVKNKSLELFIH
jgi:hypothetical protein